MDLEQYGWDGQRRAEFQSFSEEGLVPARVILQERERYTVLTETGEAGAEVSGKFRHQAGTRADYPAVGDWAAVTPADNDTLGMIQAVLPRKTVLSRKSAGQTTEEQVLAANMDTVFIVTGLDRDFNLRRIERYLTLVWESGAEPVVVLNKADICSEVEDLAAEAQKAARGVTVLPVSAREGRGLEAMDAYLEPGKTVLLVGSSGTGKTTLINRLLGSESLATAPVRENDQRGRHTTTRRHLLQLPSGALMIDTPGIREVGLWVEPDEAEAGFPEITEAGENCRFADCTHEHEPGCAVKAAVEKGGIDAGRYKNYLELQKEARFLATRKDKRSQIEEKARQRQFGRMVKRLVKDQNKEKGRD